MILELEKVNSYYGASHILFDVSLNVDKSEVVCLLGRNGAGKTTVMKSIIGWIQPKSGRIQFNDENIVGKSPYAISRRGIGIVPEDRRIFPDLTVDENMDVAVKNGKGQTKWTKERLYDLFTPLSAIRRRRAGLLSGGEQQMLSIARTLMGNPDMILLDEPTEGLSPVIIQVIEELVIKLKNEGVTMLVSEQNLKSARKFGDRCYIIDKGLIQFEGNMNDLELQPEITRKYLAL